MEGESDIKRRAGKGGRKRAREGGKEKGKELRMVWDQRRLRSGREAAPGRLINYREREGRGEEEEDRRGERANEVRSRQRNGPKEKFIAGQAAAAGPHPPRKGVKAIEESSHVFHSLTHLFEFVADEGERLVDGVRGARDGDDPLRTRAVADVDLGAALKEFSCQQICRLMCLAGRRIFLQEIKLNLPHL